MRSPPRSWCSSFPNPSPSMWSAFASICHWVNVSKPSGSISGRTANGASSIREPVSATSACSAVILSPPTKSACGSPKPRFARHSPSWLYSPSLNNADGVAAEVKEADDRGESFYCRECKELKEGNTSSFTQSGQERMTLPAFTAPPPPHLGGYQL